MFKFVIKTIAYFATIVGIAYLTGEGYAKWVENDI